MSLSSFYGGRQGASFVIVKHFDGLDIPQKEGEYVYRTREYAINSDDIYIYPFIERNSENTRHYRWRVQPLDGSTVDVDEDGVISQIVLGIEYAEGMRQCFEQGGDTTGKDGVNYGEYVIIDTIFGLHDLANPDNGKVFRRGMRYDYDPVENPLAGAEYIGQIVGPKGDIAKIDLDSYKALEEKEAEGETVFKKEYTVDNDSLTPGAYYEDGELKWHDEIKYALMDLKDGYGNILGCLIGFKIPFLVEEFIASPRHQYYEEGDNIPEGKEIGDVINNDLELIQRIDDDLHPFYRKWHIDVPKGIKGDVVKNLEIYPTLAEKYADIYMTVDAETGELSDKSTFALGTEEIDLDVYEETKEKNYVVLKDNQGYMKLEDVAGLRVRYKEVVYDNKEVGEERWIDIGSYKVIDNVTVNDDGWLTVRYSWGEDYKTQFRWINRVTIDDDGTIHFWHTDNSEMTPAIGNMKIKYLKEIFIDTDGDAEEEGQGDQRFHLVYNTLDEEGEHEVDVISRPVNYVIETTVTEFIQEYVNKGTEPYHLLVYYADPAFRAQLAEEHPEKIKTYPSVKLGKDIEEWYDLGHVRGEAGGIHIIGDFESIDDLKDEHGDWIPPEQIGHPGTVDEEHAGWVVTVDNGTGSDIMAYDYQEAVWYSIGNISEATMNPKSIIDYIDAESTPLYLKKDGFWLIQSTMDHAE